MRVTLKQVAAKAGVSYQTVSKVLNGQGQVSKETEERIWQAVKDLGYRPNYTARSLRSKRSLTIGYSWAPSRPEKASPVLDQLLQSMFQAAARHDYYLLNFPYRYDSEDQINLYRELIYTGRVDGFVLASVEYNDPRVLFLLEHNFPFVAFGRSNPDLVFPYIDVDGGLGLHMATQHLIEQDHQRIAALAWPETSRVGNNRLQGYFNALVDSGIQALPEWVIRGEGEYSVGYEATKQWLSFSEECRPTAIVAMNDAMAIGAMKAVQDYGLKVAQDIAVTGFDDIPMIQYLNPPLTSIRQPAWEVGQLVVETLLNILNEGKMPDPIGKLLPPMLIVRESSTTRPELIVTKQ